MLEKVKKSLHYSLDLYDDEITDLILSCRREAELSGVIWDDTDASITNLCRSYVKWKLNYMGMGDTWKGLYNDLLRAVALDPTMTRTCSL